MRYKPSTSERIIEQGMAKEVRRKFGRNLVSLVIEGSRAIGDALPDSDYDGIAFVRRASRANPGFAALRRRTGLRIGVGVLPTACLRRCAQGTGFRQLCLRLKLGGTRVIAGRNIVKTLPSVRTLIGRGFRKEEQEDYWWAVLPTTRSCVFKREPRRHVGFIIAICNSLLLTKGIMVRKQELPRFLKKYHPRFAVIRLLKRALWRRAHWPEIGQDKRQIAGALRDLKEFLRRYRRYVFGKDGRGLTADEFMTEWRLTHRDGKMIC
jgi:hypothetical protein